MSDWLTLNSVIKKLKQSKNVILHGAPGTGKTFLARNIAARMVSGEENYDYEALKSDYEALKSEYKALTSDNGDEEKKRSLEEKMRHLERLLNQIDFVQFHPSYDYTDFVEGLRPVQGDSSGKDDSKKSESDEIGFKWQPGTFMRFCMKADKNLMPSYNRKDLGECGDGKNGAYVFIIDEVNRGEISKIFGELFFSIDPGYRGKEGEVLTQYSNLHPYPEKNEKFYVPENVYVIGTMNDIDRSVDTFDFAMRRRFRFIDVPAEFNSKMFGDNAYWSDPDRLSLIKEHMDHLNASIGKEPALGKNYEIGCAYFTKLCSMTDAFANDGTGDDGPKLMFKALWRDYLEPLLYAYLEGYEEKESIHDKFYYEFFPEEKKPSPDDNNNNPNNGQGGSPAGNDGSGADA